MREKLYDSITNLPDEVIEKSQNHKFSKKSNKKWWISAVAAVLVVCVTVTALIWSSHRTEIILSKYVVTKAAYPQWAPYPDGLDSDSEKSEKWYASRATHRRPEGYADGLENFFSASIKEFLSDSNGKNKIYSPVNVYLALGMLAEVSDGNSRAQILELLGSNTIEDLRKQASDVWNANYRDDGAVTSILASSLWLNEQVEYSPDTMQTLADVYYASSYQGKMGSSDFNEAFQTWLNEQTGGLLKDQISALQLSPETILALATTINFSAKWTNDFNPEETQEGIFHATTGDVSCEFMYEKNRSDTYFWGDSFGAVEKSLDQGSMIFILPDEGVSVDELLQDSQITDFIMSSYAWENKKALVINSFIPKFDIYSQSELTQGLKNLGVTDVFDPVKSDFTPMTTQTEEIFVSQVQHDVRVAIDEEGVMAVAYTLIPMNGSAMPKEEEIDFILDRPFIFVLTGADNVPLFVGVVNNP